VFSFMQLGNWRISQHPNKISKPRLNISRKLPTSKLFASLNLKSRFLIMFFPYTISNPKIALST